VFVPREVYPHDVGKNQKKPKAKTKHWYDKKQSLTEFSRELANRYLESGSIIIEEIPDEVQSKREFELAAQFRPHCLRTFRYIHSPTLTFNDFLAIHRLAEKKGDQFLRRLAKGLLQHKWAYLDELTDRQLTLLTYSWHYIKKGSVIDALVSAYGKVVLSMPDHYLLSSLRNLQNSTDLGNGLSATVLSSSDDMMLMANHF
jgi:hypothetical protein